MKHDSTSFKLNGIAQNTSAMSAHLQAIQDVAFDIRMECLFYAEENHKFENSNTEKSLLQLAERLERTYIKAAVVMGVDPCGKLLMPSREESKYLPFI